MQDYFGLEEPRAIFKWQAGKSLPTVDNLYALSALLGVPMDTILVPVGREECGANTYGRQADVACRPSACYGTPQLPGNQRRSALLRPNFCPADFAVHSAGAGRHALSGREGKKKLGLPAYHLLSDRYGDVSLGDSEGERGRVGAGELALCVAGKAVRCAYRSENHSGPPTAGRAF